MQLHNKKPKNLMFYSVGSNLLSIIKFFFSCPGRSVLRDHS